MSKSLLKAWENCSSSDMKFGIKAYPNYQALCRLWAKTYRFGYVQTVEAFASLSPNSDYHGNIRSLTSCMEGLNNGLTHEQITVSTYGTMKRKALLILQGETSFLDTTGGPKIRAFRDCILYPQYAQTPVIDGHMANLWAGQHGTMQDGADILRGSGYETVSQDFRRLARSKRLPIPMVQATLWAYQKRTSGVMFDPQLQLFSGATRWDELPNPIDYPAYPAKMTA